MKVQLRTELVDCLCKVMPEQRSWSDANFPGNPSFIAAGGVMEEFGELMHSLIKTYQGIRGTADELRAESFDALGDIVIYMLDYIGREKITVDDLYAWMCVKEGISVDENIFPSVFSCSAAVGMALSDLYGGCFAYLRSTQVSGFSSACILYRASRSLYLLDILSNMLGFDLVEVIRKTWDQVKQRDWSKNKKNGEISENS